MIFITLKYRITVNSQNGQNSLSVTKVICRHSLNCDIFSHSFVCPILDMVSVKIHYQILNSFLLIERCSGKKPMKDMLGKKSLISIMNEELLALFFKYSTSFFLIRKVSNYNRKVCVFIRKTWFLPHSHNISSGYAFFLT